MNDVMEKESDILLSICEFADSLEKQKDTEICGMKLWIQF